MLVKMEGIRIIGGDEGMEFLLPVLVLDFQSGASVSSGSASLGNDIV
jgi:hypothetical protein